MGGAIEMDDGRRGPIGKDHAAYGIKAQHLLNLCLVGGEGHFAAMINTHRGSRPEGGAVRDQKAEELLVRVGAIHSGMGAVLLPGHAQEPSDVLGITDNDP